MSFILRPFFERCRHNGNFVYKSKIQVGFSVDLAVLDLDAEIGCGPQNINTEVYKNAELQRICLNYDHS